MTMHKSERSIIAALVVVCMAMACTRAVEIPRDQFESAAKSQKVSHRITTTDGSSYLVDRFSVTDSTLAIAELDGADERYEQIDLPIILHREDVTLIEKLELDPGKSFFVVAPIGLLLIIIVAVATGPPLLN